MPTKPLRVLVVEDSADDADLLLLDLGRGGFEPTALRVDTADRFRAVVATEPWDVILCDNALPDFDASQALDILRQLDAVVPLIVVSGTIGEERAVELMRAGASDYMMKGRLSRLAAAVEREVRQVAERRQRQRAEREARDLAAIVASSDDAIVGKALDGTITSWNAGAERLYGYPASAIVGRNAAVLISPDRPEEEVGLLRRVARGERVEHYETERVRRDGTRVHVSVTLSPVRDDAGRVVGASVIARDISERKRAEEARQRAEQQARDLAAIVASSDDAIIGLTLDGVIRTFNGGAERLYGYPAAEIIGRSAPPFLPPERRGEYSDVLGRVGRGERIESFESVRVHRDGTRFDVSVTASPIRDDAGRVVGASVIARDITDRKRAEERQTRDALILANVRDAVIVTDPTGVTTYWNEGATRLFGWTAAEMLGRPLTDRVPEAHRGAMAEATRAILAGVEFAGEWEDWRKDGSRVWIDARVSRITDAAGKVVGVLGLSHDITDRKRAEEGLAQREREGRLLVAELEAERTRLEAAQAAGKVGSWETDPGTEAVRWSRETYRIFEVEPDGVPLTHHRFLNYVHAEDRERVDAAFRKSQRQQSSCSTTHRIITAGGRLKHVEEWWRVEFDSRDVPVRVVGTCQDITQRVQAYEALRLSEQRYRTLIEATAAIVWDSPASGEFDSPQPGWTAFTGQTVEQHRGWGWLDAVHPDDRAESGRAWAAAVSTRTVYRVEHRLRRADGVYRHMAVRAVPILDAGGAIREWVGVHADVTEQKLADDAIRESEARYRSLADAMPQIVWETGPDGYHDFFNRQWYDYTGLTLEQSKGDGWNSVFHPDDRPSASERWRHALTTGDPFEGEYRRRRHDGEYRWFLVRALPQRDAAGQIVRWFGTATDIHDFKEAQADRYAALAQLNLQIERMPLAYLLHDADFRYTGWNPAAERIFGFTRAEVLGKLPFEVVVPPRSQAVVADIFTRLAAGDMDAHLTNENVTKDGRTITCEWYNTPLFGPDGTFQGVLSLAQDITVRRQAEHALLLRDRAIRAVVGGILITDANAPDNPISYVSPGFTQLTGYTGVEAIGRNCRFLQGKDTDQAAVAEVREAVRQGVHCDVELLNYLKDGTPFWNALSISPVRDEAGRLTNFIGVQTDVTGRRKLENQFHQAQKMEAVGQLAGGVAHDFNNLLTVINGYGEIVHAALPPGHPSRELVEEITKAGERAAGLTRQLLAFSRQSVLEPKVLDPNALIRDVEKMLRRLIGEDIDLAAKLAPDLGRVKADPGQLEQAVVNLCVNARDAMPTGGKLTVETRNVELDAAYVATHPDVRPGPYVVVAVSDTGTGMTPEVQARIFEPFFTTKEQGKGTGLGLAMVFGFVKQSGGHVGVHSEVGRGTTFKLYMPRVTDAPLSGKSGINRTPMPKGTETVLLVEDEDAVRALGRHVLVICGYTVLEAGNGREAVKAAVSHAGPIHLLVTDVVMPGGMGGRQVAEAVVARHPAAKVLFTSGYTDDAVVRHGVLDEGTHFLQKPFTPTALAQKVRDVLDGKG